MEHGSGHRVVRPAQDARSIAGRERLLLCTNDYLGLACDPRVVAAAREALTQYGFGSRAARSLAGDTDAPPSARARARRASRATEAALIFGSGFTCNVGVIAALTTRRRCDLQRRAQPREHRRRLPALGRAHRRVYPHGDLGDLEAILRESSSAAKRMIVTDAVFSMDGDVAPLPEIVELADRYDAFVMLDDAHATGVLGPNGEGTLEHFGLAGRVPVLMGTLGKALGSVGGFVAGSRDLVDDLARKARSFLFTTSLPPSAAAAALASLRILRAEPERVHRLWDERPPAPRGARRARLRCSIDAGRDHAGLPARGSRCSTGEPAAVRARSGRPGGGNAVRAGGNRPTAA